MTFLKRFRLWVFILFAIFLLNTPTAFAAPGEYPEGTINFTSSTARDITVTAGQPINYRINITKGTKVCNVFVIYYKISGRNPRNTTNPITHAVARGQTSFQISGTLNTTGLSNGTYRLFIYGSQDCPDSTDHGNQDDEFACDGNPTCFRYCGASQTSRPANQDGGAEEPGDLYRTSSNPAYSAPYGSASCGGSGPYYPTGNYAQNSCGEISGGPSCDDPSFAQTNNPARVGECDLKACDPTGKNLDNLTFSIGAPDAGHGGAATPGPSASLTPGTTPRPAGTPRPASTPRPSAVPGIPSPAKFIAAGPQVCLAKDDPNKTAVQVDWESSAAYSAYALTRTTCTSLTVCGNDEKKMHTEFIVSAATDQAVLSFLDPTVEVNKFYRYRVWGQLKGQPQPTTPIAQWDQRFWSRPLTVQTEVCNDNEGGLKLKEYKIETDTSPIPASSLGPGFGPGGGTGPGGGSGTD